MLFLQQLFAYLVVDLNFYLGGNIELYVIITWDIDSSIFSKAYCQKFALEVLK